MEDIVDVASLLRELRAVGLHAYLLYDRIGSVEPTVELLAWTLRLNSFPDNKTMSLTSTSQSLVHLSAYFFGVTVTFVQYSSRAAQSSTNFSARTFASSTLWTDPSAGIAWTVASMLGWKPISAKNGMTPVEA